MENKTLCEKCDNTGIVFLPFGEEDYNKDYCTCPEGKKKEMLEEVLSDDEFGGTTVGDVLNMVANDRVADVQYE